MRDFVPNVGPQEDFLASTAFEAFYGGAAGGGKIQRLDAVVWTPFGPQAIGDLSPGDQVCTPDGGHARVLLTHPVQRVDLYRMTFSDGASTIVGGDHLWHAWLASTRTKAERRWPHGQERRRGRTWTTDQLIEVHRKAERNAVRGKRTYRPIIPLSEPLALTPPSPRGINPRKVPPYVLGVLLGDGTMTPRNKVVGLTTADPMIAWEVCVELGGDGIKQRSDRYWYFKRSPKLWRQLRDLGCLGYSHTKAVPRCYKLAPIADRLAILQGLLDTDGTADTRGHISFTSTSKQLALDVQWLARSLGYRATLSDGGTGSYVNHDGKRVECRDTWDVYVAGHGTHQLFRLPRKAARCRKFNGGASEPGRRLVDVQHIGKDEARCITIDHPAGLYLTDDFIVTHNSAALIIAPLRWVSFQQFRAVIFRRTWPELRRHLLREVPKFYMPLGAVQRAGGREWHFPSGAIIELASMDHPDARFRYDSAAYHFAAFDELTAFEEQQYTYLISRIRKDTNDPIPLRLRAASNPAASDVGKWALQRFAPWVYQPGQNVDEYEGPYAAPGEVLWFYRDDEESAERIVDASHPGALSRVFFPATIDDNPHIGPEYADQLRLLDPLTYAQKRYGDWMKRPAPGMFFRRDMFHIIPLAPADISLRARYWDLAATPSDKDTGAADKGPDWTAGVLQGLRKPRNQNEDHNGIVIEDVARARLGPEDVERYIVNTALADRDSYPTQVLHIIEQEPGASGKIAAHAIVKALANRRCLAKAVAPSGDKVKRARPVSAQANMGNISVLQAPWNRVLFDELEGFPFGKKDQVDSLSGGYAELALGDKKPVGPLSAYRG